MKTKQNPNQKKGLLNRSDEQRSTSTAQQTTDKTARVLPFVNFTERDKNRSLPTDKVLDLLHEFLPAHYGLAEVVGKWIWITFPEPPPEQVRSQLSQFGFHWNNVRKCWQHPCGQTLPRGSQEPQQKYEVWFPMNAEKRRREKEAAAQAAPVAA